MIKKSSFFLQFVTTITFLVVASLLSCSDPPTSAVREIPPPVGVFEADNYVFFRTDSTVTLLTKTCSCIRDTVIKHLDTTYYKYILKKDSLQIVYIPSDTIDYSIHLLFVRLSGKDLEGDWLFNSSWYRVNEPCLKTDSLRVLLTFNQYSGKDFSWLRIKQNDFIIFSDTGIPEFTSYYHLAHLAQSYDKKYNITFDSISPLSYRLLGNNTNDSLTITSVSADTTILFRSNDISSFPDYTFKNDRSICYDFLYPDWYEKFLKQNSFDANIDYSHLFLEKLRNDSTLNKYYDITYDSISPYSLRIIGNVSNDTITIVKTFKMDIIFTSNNPLFNTYITNDYNPNPAGKYPPWLQTTPGNFQSLNLKKSS